MFESKIKSANPLWIAPSILSADLARLGDDVAKVVTAGADLIHFDVMDNHYVPNLTFGPAICKSLRDYGITQLIDVHLMVEPPDSLIQDFAKAGANYISFHPEASRHVHRSVKLAKDLGVKVGLAFNPASSLDILEYIIDELDLILLMSVNPGFGGQKFINQSLDKAKKVAKLIKHHNPNIRLQMDGGIKTDNIKQVYQAGVDTFVAGSAIFNSNDYKKTIDAMRSQLS